MIDKTLNELLPEEHVDTPIYNVDQPDLYFELSCKRAVEEKLEQPQIQITPYCEPI